MENIVEKIRRLCKEKGVAVYKLERDLKFGNGFLNPKKASDIQVSRLLSILDYLGVTVQDFFAEESREAHNIVSLPSKSTEFQRKYSTIDAHGRALVDMILDAEYARCTAPVEAEIVTIRHYLSRPAAGVNGLVEGEDYEDIPLPPDAPKGADFCLTVSGDSMEPYIRDGEMIYVSEKAQVQDMDVGVFFYDGATYVKQYCKGYDDSVYLLSANPLREDANITIKKDSASSLVCFGKVLLPKKLPRPNYQKDNTTRLS